MKPKEHGADGRALIWLLVVVVLMLSAVRSDAQTPTWYPSWWSSYGVLSGTTPADYGAANQGAAKNIAVAAVSELDNDLAQFGGAGSTLDALAATLLASDTSGAAVDYGAISLGQMKFLAQPFYDRLMAVGYFGPPLYITGTYPSTTGTYPWAAPGLTPNDYAMGSIGQLKNLFSFNVNYTSPGNTSGIPDWWVNLYYPGLIASGSASILNGYVAWSGSQVTTLQAFQQGLNPIDFYNGQTPTLAIVSGSGLTGSPGGFIPAPLIVEVSNASGPIVGAPVSFAVVTSGSLWQTNLQSLPNPTTLLTDQNGQAKVYFQLPNSQNATCTIVASAVTASGQPQVSGTFTESSDDGGGTYTNPFAPSNVVANMNPDGSVDVSWTNNCDPNDATLIDIQYKDPNGNWVDCVENLPAGTTSHHVPAQ